MSSLSQSVIVKKRLALEYDGSSQTSFTIIQWVYNEAHCFSCKADWYEGTIALDDWFGIHGEFFTVYSIGGFTDGHNNSLLIVVDGYGACIVIPDNFCIETFHECTERNHGSPVAVNVRSCIHFEELLVNNILGGTDRHGYIVVSVDVALTEGVVKAANIEALVRSIFYSNTDGNISVFSAVNGQFAFTVLNILLNVYGNNSIVIALIFDVSHQLAVNLSLAAIFFNDSYINVIVFFNRTFSWIEFEAEGVIRVNNRQSNVCIQVANQDDAEQIRGKCQECTGY